MLKKPRRYMRPVHTTKQDNTSLLYMQGTAQNRNHHGTQLLTGVTVTVKSAPNLFFWGCAKKALSSSYLVQLFSMAKWKKNTEWQILVFFNENFLLASMRLLPRHEASTGCSQ